MEQALNLKSSSNIKGATFNPDDQTITISFHSGHQGQYLGCTEEDARDFENADSPGKHLHAVIKPQRPYKPL
jgi:hypothetical protein